MLRGDSVHDVTDAARDQLVVALGVRDVLDLRTEIERATVGAGPLSADARVRVHHLSFVREQLAASPTDLARAALLVAEDDERSQLHSGGFWARHYAGYLAGRPESIDGGLQVLAQATGATLVHCAAGKDRTGTFVAMALAVAGVPHDEIAADYALSAERIEAILERLRALPAYAELLRDRTPAQEAPRAEAMAAFLSWLDDEHGGAVGWLRARNWSVEQINGLRARLVA